MIIKWFILSAGPIYSVGESLIVTNASLSLSVRNESEKSIWNLGKRLSEKYDRISQGFRFENR